MIEAEALAHAIEALIERIVTRRIEDVGSSATQLSPSPWVTPPQAARCTGVPVKTIRTLVREQRITARLRNRTASPRQPKFLVNIDEIARAVALEVVPRALGRQRAGGLPNGLAEQSIEQRAASLRGFVARR